MLHHGVTVQSGAGARFVEIGFNDDVQYRSVTFHLQTEDHGISDGRVSSQLFLAGRILDSTEVSYLPVIEGISDEEQRSEKIRKVMVASHRRLYKKLLSGALDGNAGLGETQERAPDPSLAENFEPSQSRVPQAAQVLEEDGKVTFTFDEGEAMDLSALADQLSQVDVMPPDGEVSAEKGGETFGDLGAMGVDEEPVLPAFTTGRRAYCGFEVPAAEMKVLKWVADHLAAG